MFRLGASLFDPSRVPLAAEAWSRDLPSKPPLVGDKKFLAPASRSALVGDALLSARELI